MDKIVPESPIAAPGDFAPAEKRARLVAIEGPLQGQEFPLDRFTLNIGRATENDLIVEGALVSRHHACIEQQEAQFILIDRESANGTYINGHRIQSQPLVSGDTLQFGACLFIFTDQKESAPSRAVEPAAPEPIPQIRNLDDFQIAETIGGGGSASVYKGITREGTVVAIKRLNTTDETLRKKFVAEGWIGRSLRHPHIAQVYHYGDSNGTPYIVMEFVDGGSLRRWLAQGQPASWDFICPVIGQACEALEYAHAHQPQVIHRDIKPENLLLSMQGGLKVADFGIAKVVDAAFRTTTGIRLGTPYYMSCEQARGIDVSPASDIYSLGVILYEMLTGVWPFRGAPMEVVRKHIAEQPMPPRQLNPSIPPELEEIVLRALHKNPARRFGSMMELAHAIGYRADMLLQLPQIHGVQTIDSLPAQIIVSPPSGVSPLPAPILARLIVFEQGNRSSVIPLREKMVELGRQEIKSSDTEISRQHIRFIQMEGKFYLEDLGSLNGTLHNRRRMRAREPVMLNHSDVIQVGQTVMQFEQ